MLRNSLSSRNNSYKMVIQSPRMSRKMVTVKRFGQSLREHAQQRRRGQTGLWLSHTRWWTRNRWRGRELGSTMKEEKFWMRP
eukprot:6858357-Karenia_brevis.AAC.1